MLTISEEIPALPSTLAEKVLSLDGKPFDLHNGYNLYINIHDCGARKVLLKNARQTGKTITIATKMALKAAFMPYRKSLYISPSDTQTSRFSHSKLKKMLQGSQYIKSKLTGKEVTDNVYLKILNNGSEINLSYASDDPDRIRGATSDDNYYDEIQDMSIFEVMIVAGSCSDASTDPTWTSSGTPKSIENGMEDLWQQSTMSEPVVKCDGCNKYNVPTEKNIGKFGFICANCGKLLNVRDFIWVDFNKSSIKGFHIPQIVVPFHTENTIKWEELLFKYEKWPKSRFKNEILAESDSTGKRLIERGDLEKLCTPYSMATTPHPSMLSGVEFNVAGVDWSGGGAHGNSRTVVHIWGVMPNMKLKTLFYKIFPTEDPVASVAQVTEILNIFNVRFVMGDRGEGALANGLLEEKLGKHRVGQVFYGSHREPFTIDPKSGVYQIDKTVIIDNYFKFLKDCNVLFPDKGDMREGFDDVMNEFSEVTKMGKKIWTHSPSKPDDCLHAQVFGWLAFKLLKRDLIFY